MYEKYLLNFQGVLVLFGSGALYTIQIFFFLSIDPEDFPGADCFMKTHRLGIDYYDNSLGGLGSTVKLGNKELFGNPKIVP